MKTKRAIVVGNHGRHHKVFLIRGARVVKEWDTDKYLKLSKAEIKASIPSTALESVRCRSIPELFE